jgi:hypothetical protein
VTVGGCVAGNGVVTMAFGPPEATTMGASEPAIPRSAAIATATTGRATSDDKANRRR